MLWKLFPFQSLTEVEERDEHFLASDRLSDGWEEEEEEEDAPVNSPEEGPIIRELEESWKGIDEVVSEESITIWMKIKHTL